MNNENKANPDDFLGFLRVGADEVKFFTAPQAVPPSAQQEAREVEELRERLVVATEERDVARGQARASESALTAVAWPLVQWDGSGDSPDIIAARLVAQLATARKDSERAKARLDWVLRRISTEEMIRIMPNLSGKTVGESIDATMTAQEGQKP